MIIAAQVREKMLELLFETFGIHSRDLKAIETDGLLSFLNQLTRLDVEVLTTEVTYIGTKETAEVYIPITELSAYVRNIGIYVDPRLIGSPGEPDYSIFSAKETGIYLISWMNNRGEHTIYIIVVR